MTPQSVRKLRGNFIAIATASFFVVIAFMGIATVVVNAIAIRSQAESTIDAILDAGGEMPAEANFTSGAFHEEASYGLRFFTVSYDKHGEVESVGLTHVALVDAQKALEISEVTSDPDSIVGLSRFEDYFYKEGETENGSMVVFLDCSFQLANMQEVVRNTLLLSCSAFLITLISIVFFSKRAIRAEMENAHRQQQFMTNASHELKTPIAVIRANTEVTEMISGQTEWTQSTLAQVNRLEGLVSDLMTIVRGEERASTDAGFDDFDVSAVVQSAVDSFKAMAQKHNLKLESSIDSGVMLRGNEASMEQLTCLLVDNALKYCDEGGTVKVRLASAIIGRGCTLAVSNEFAAGSDVDYRRFFDRFYRADESHENQQGYGIGLSVAESICERYHGSIRASWKAGVISFICTLKDA